MGLAAPYVSIPATVPAHIMVADTHIWEPTSGTAASTAANWVDETNTPNGLPGTGDFVIFQQGTPGSVTSCSWDLSVTLGNFTMKQAYSGTVTSATSWGTGDFTIKAGTYTGRTTDVITMTNAWTKSGGTVTNYLVNLKYSASGSITSSASLYIYKVVIDAGYTLTMGSGSSIIVISQELTIGTGSTLSIPSGRTMYSPGSYAGGTTYSNSGTISGAGTMLWRLGYIDPTITFGTVTISNVNIFYDGYSPTGTRTLYLGTDTTFSGTLSIQGQTVTPPYGTTILNTNNKKLTVGGLTTILSDGRFAQGTDDVAFNGGLTINGNNALLTQGAADINIGGTTTLTTGTFTGNPAYTVRTTASWGGTTGTKTADTINLKMSGTNTLTTGVSDFYTVETYPGSVITLGSDVHYHGTFIAQGTVNEAGFSEIGSEPESMAIFGTTNQWIGDTLHAVASDSTHWSQGHVPATGENILFDGASVRDCRWDIGKTLKDFVILSNYTKWVTVLNEYLHQTGNITTFGTGGIETQGTMADNFVVEGKVHLRGNVSGGYSPFFSLNAAGHDYYFNGAFNASWPSVGSFSAVANANYRFNSTFSIIGTMSAWDGTNFAVDVSWGGGSAYMDFYGNVLLSGIHTLNMGSGASHENITVRNIGIGSGGLAGYPPGYLLMVNDHGDLPFTYHKSPVFANIVKCSTCGYTPYIEIRYINELNQTTWDGWITDYIHYMDVNTSGIVNQSASMQFGSPSLTAGYVNIEAGVYRINGSYNMVISPGNGLGGWGTSHTGTLVVRDCAVFDVTSGFLVTDEVQLIDQGVFMGSTGQFSIYTYWDSFDGIFDAGTSKAFFNGTGTVINTNGTSAPATSSGGFYDMHIYGSVTLYSDVWVNHWFSNSGTINYNGYHIYNNGSTYPLPVIHIITSTPMTTAYIAAHYAYIVITDQPSSTTVNMTTNADWLFINGSVVEGVPTSGDAGLYWVHIRTTGLNGTVWQNYTITVIEGTMDMQMVLSIIFGLLFTALGFFTDRRWLLVFAGVIWIAAAVIVFIYIGVPFMVIGIGAGFIMLMMGGMSIDNGGDTK